MRLVRINNQERLNKFVGEQRHSRFSNTWEWGEFQKRIGNKIWRPGIKDDEGRLVAAATLIKRLLPGGGGYFYCPHGPLVKLKVGGERLNVLNFFFREIKKMAKKEKAIFLRFEPEFTIQNLKLKIKKTIAVQPAKTLVLNLKKSEEELLAAMHQKTRYNIRLAGRRGVEVREGSGNEFKEFWRLLKETGARDRFCPHPKNYYQEMLAAASRPIGGRDRLYIKLFFARYNKEIVATGLFAFFGDTAAYMHGGSSNKFRNVMSPYLLQWRVIKSARELGYSYYDFYGIDEEKWPGVTRFKRGFGGQVVEYPGTFDLIFHPVRYWLYCVARRVRRCWRRKIMPKIGEEAQR